MSEGQRRNDSLSLNCLNELVVADEHAVRVLLDLVGDLAAREAGDKKVVSGPRKDLATLRAKLKES